MNKKKDYQYSYRLEANVNNIDLTKLMKLLLLLISMISGIQTHSLCSINICLRWTTRQNTLTIICKVDDLNLPVYIYNNFGIEIARCSIPFPSPLCTPTDNNIVVHQNASTHETIVNVRRKIDRSINGNWSCRHGYGISKYDANIEINIQAPKGQNKTEKTDELRCLKVISFYIVTGVTISVVLVSICLIITWKCTQGEEQHFKRIVSLSEMIDDIFGAKNCDEHSVKHKKIGFFISFVILVFGAGILIGLLEKDSCTGSIVFLILGILLCLTLLILFLRSQGDGGATELSRAGDSSAGRTHGSNNEETNNLDDAIGSFSGGEQISDDSDACEIKGSALAECYRVNITGPKYVKRNEAIHVVCSSEQTPIGLTTDFLVNGITYTSLRSTHSGCYSAHLRTRCPSNSVFCHCSNNGKEYGLLINAAERNSTMTILCLMKFQNDGQVYKSDSLVVDIYDPPSLKIKENVQCNHSSSVDIVCESLGVPVIYDDWFHFYNGMLIKKMKVKTLNNRSTISIESCGIEDSGEYMCKAGYTIANKTFWANVTTYLKFQGPPIAFETHETIKPTKFSIVFYSSAEAIMITWHKDNITLANSTDFELLTNRHNISVDSNGVTMVLHGYMTSLVVSRRLSGAYSVLLRNDFGEYYRQFSIPPGKTGFSLQTFIWILICATVFLINSTIGTLTCRRRTRRFLKGSGSTGTAGIYYAAPSTTDSTSQYNSTRQQNDTDATDNSASNLYDEIIDEQVHHADTDEMSHHYIELE